MASNPIKLKPPMLENVDFTLYHFVGVRVIVFV